MTLRESSKTVQDYKIAEANKYSLGMAINNAAVIAAKNINGYDREDMKKLIKNLFELYKEIRKEELGY